MSCFLMATDSMPWSCNTSGSSFCTVHGYLQHKSEDITQNNHIFHKQIRLRVYFIYKSRGEYELLYSLTHRTIPLSHLNILSGYLEGKNVLHIAKVGLYESVQDNSRGMNVKGFYLLNYLTLKTLLRRKKLHFHPKIYKLNGNQN